MNRVISSATTVVVASMAVPAFARKSVQQVSGREVSIVSNATSVALSTQTTIPKTGARSL